MRLSVDLEGRFTGYLKGEIMDPSYTQDLRNRPEKHPETPTDAILIIVSMIREVC